MRQRKDNNKIVMPSTFITNMCKSEYAKKENHSQSQDKC